MTDEIVFPDELRSRILGLSSFDAVNVARFWVELGGCDPDRVALEGDDPLLGVLGRALQLQSDRNIRFRTIQPEVAEKLARGALLIALQSENTAPLLVEALDRHDADESMNAIEILTIGTVVTLVIMAATIQVEWRSGGPLIVKKHALTDLTIRKMFELLSQIVATLPDRDKLDDK